VGAAGEQVAQATGAERMSPGDRISSRRPPSTFLSRSNQCAAWGTIALFVLCDGDPDPRHIGSEGSHSGSTPVPFTVGAASSGNMLIEAGTQDVQATVTVTYALT
jgi:hypothetical protein